MPQPDASGAGGTQRKGATVPGPVHGASVPDGRLGSSATVTSRTPVGGRRYIGLRRPGRLRQTPAVPSPSLLPDPPPGPAVDAVHADDVAWDGYVMNLTRVWAWRPDVLASFGALRGELTGGSGLSARDLAVLVTATAAARGDAYCALAWGTKLAGLSDEATAVTVLRTTSGAPAGPDADGELSERDAALAAWAGQVVRDPNATTGSDVDRLRAAGLGDREIFEATAWVAFRLAFSTVNDALGALPDPQLAEQAPPGVRAAVTFGRRP